MFPCSKFFTIYKNMNAKYTRESFKLKIHSLKLTDFHIIFIWFSFTYNSLRHPGCYQTLKSDPQKLCTHAVTYTCDSRNDINVSWGWSSTIYIRVTRFKLIYSPNSTYIQDMTIFTTILFSIVCILRWTHSVLSRDHTLHSIMMSTLKDQHFGTFLCLYKFPN